MGFPVGYSDLLLPRFLCLLLSVLGHLRRLIAFALRAAGLDDLLLDPEPSSSHDPQQRPDHQHHLPHSASAAAAWIRSLLPVARYGDLGGAVEDDDVPESCAVCLHEFGPEDEVRRLSNCRHVFHCVCIDPWVELDQRTCPLCRAALVPKDALCGGGGGAPELGWGSSSGNPVDGGSAESLYPLADPVRFVVWSQIPHPDPLPWFLLPPDAAAAAATPALELW